MPEQTSGKPWIVWKPGQFRNKLLTMVERRLSVDDMVPASISDPLADSSVLGVRTDTVEMPVKLCNLPPLNAIANRVLLLSSDPDVDLKKLAAVMECDPAFAADVLLLAN